MSEGLQPRAGWYIDPEQPELQRYWDGWQWTERTAPAPSTAPPPAPVPPIGAEASHATAEATRSFGPDPAASGQPPTAHFSPAPQDSAAAPPAANPPYVTQPSQAATYQQGAPEPQRSGGRIGRGTIVFILVGAIAIAIGGSVLLNGGLPF